MPITDGRILLDAANANTNWVDLAGGGSGTQDTDVRIEGSASLGLIGSTTRIGLLFDAGTTSPLGEDWSNNTFYFWINSSIVPLMETQNLGGFTIRFTGPTVTDWFEVYVGGSDNWPKSVQGGWTQFVIDIDEARAIAVATQSPTRGGTNGTPPATTAIQRVGFSVLTATVMPKHVDNTWIDALYRLPNGTPGITISGKNTAVSPAVPYTWDDVLLAADYTDTTKAWGTAKELDGIVFLNTPIQFGNNGSPDDGDHDFEATNKVITWEGQEFLPDGFYGFDIVGDATNSQRFVAGTSSGSGDDEVGSQGWTILADAAAPRWDVTATDAELDQVDWLGCVFQHGGVFDFNNPANKHVSGTFNDVTSLLHSVGASPISGGTFLKNTILQANVPDGSPIHQAFLSTGDPNLIRFCTFLFNNNHGIEITATGTFDFVGNLFSGYSLGSPELDTPIMMNAGGGALTLNVTEATLTAAEVYLVDNSPENTVTVNNNVLVTLTDIEPGTEVRVYPVESPINTTEIAGIESVGSPAEFQFSAAASLLVRIVVLHIDFVLPPANEFEFTIPASATQFPLSQLPDRNFSNP